MAPTLVMRDPFTTNVAPRSKKGHSKQSQSLAGFSLLPVRCRRMAGTISTPVPRQWPLVDPVEAYRRTRGEGGIVVVVVVGVISFF